MLFATYDSTDNGYRSYSLLNGTATALPGPLPGGTYNHSDSSYVQAVNSSGVIAGSYNNAYQNGSAITWQPGATTGTLLTTLPGYSRSEAYAINSLGQAAGYSGDGLDQVQVPVMWTGTTPIALGNLPNYTNGWATGINASDTVVGVDQIGFGNPAFDTSFLWSNGQLYNLNSLIAQPGWSFIQAYAINDAGDIVGTGFVGGSQEYFLLTPLPEPAGMSMIGLASFKEAAQDVRIAE